MHNINNKQSKVRIRSENKLTSGGMSLSCSGSIPSVGGAELAEATVPRSLVAGARARLLRAPTLERRIAAREAGRFLDPVAPTVGRGGTTSSTGSGANMKRKKPSTAGSEVTLEEPLVRAHVGEASGVGVQIQPLHATSSGGARTIRWRLGEDAEVAGDEGNDGPKQFRSTGEEDCE